MLSSPGGLLGNAPGASSSARICSALAGDPWGHLAAPRLGLVAPTRCRPLGEVSCSCRREGWSRCFPWLRFSSLVLELKHCFLHRPRIPVTLNMKMVMPSWSVLWVAGVGGTLFGGVFGE